MLISYTLYLGLYLYSQNLNNKKREALKYESAALALVPDARPGAHLGAEALEHVPQDV